MQNDLKYGKLSEMCGINGYFAGNNRKKSRLRRQNFSLRGTMPQTTMVNDLENIIHKF